MCFIRYTGDEDLKNYVWRTNDGNDQGPGPNRPRQREEISDEERLKRLERKVRQAANDYFSEYLEEEEESCERTRIFDARLIILDMYQRQYRELHIKLNFSNQTDETSKKDKAIEAADKLADEEGQKLLEHDFFQIVKIKMTENFEKIKTKL